jgi:hypothetical protein
MLQNFEQHCHREFDISPKGNGEILAATLPDWNCVLTNLDRCNHLVAIGLTGRGVMK